MNANSPSRIADLLPDYEVGPEIGRGAMGVVHLGRHRHLHRDVAIKELPLGLVDDAEVRSRFLTEARTLARLDHPNIVPVYDFVDRDGHCLLVMEALRGGTLWDRFTRDGLTIEDSVAVAIDTSLGVEHAHRNGVLHRDIKPENLLFSAPDHLKVTDFGIAKVINGDHTMATIDGSVLGTPAYMAPEQAEGAEVGPAADVYAIGAVLFELVSGRLPFEGDSPMALLVERIMNEAPDVRSFAPDLPEPIASVIAAALVRDPADRIESAGALASRLERAAEEAWGSAWRETGAIHIDDRSTAGSEPHTPADRAGPADRDETRSDPTIAPVGRGASETVPPRGQRLTVKPLAVHAPVEPIASIDRGQLVDIATLVKKPGKTWPFWIVAGLAIALTLLLVVRAPQPSPSEFGSGAAPTIDGLAISATEVNDVALDDIMRIGPVDGESVVASLDYAGLTVWSRELETSSGFVDVDLGPLGYVLSGPMLLRIEDPAGSAETVIAVRSTRRWFETLQLPALIGIVLLAGSMLEFRLRSFRKGSIRLTMMVGAGIAAAVLAAAATMILAQRSVEFVTTDRLVTAAVSAAAAAVLSALARARFARARRRRRIRLNQSHARQ